MEIPSLRSLVGRECSRVRGREGPWTMDRTLGPGEMGDLGAEVFDLGVWVKR